jgi:hypothetical protein
MTSDLASFSVDYQRVTAAAPPHMSALSHAIVYNVLNIG